MMDGQNDIGPFTRERGEYTHSILGPDVLRIQDEMPPALEEDLTEEGTDEQ